MELIDEKIQKSEGFIESLRLSLYPGEHGLVLYDEEFEDIYQSIRILLKELFDSDEAVYFEEQIELAGSYGDSDHEYRRKRSVACISLLRAYKEKVERFWTEKATTTTTIQSSIPFISMSFNEKDKETNDYVVSILEALRIEFETGERYSKDSIPQKVKNRLLGSDPVIIIFVRRDKLESGEYTTPSWLLKELGMAQTADKNIIAFVEKGIKDIANLNYEKEVIYFDRDNVQDMMKAAIKFLEALKEHGLI
ncbi:MAG: hypothetical protein SWK76_17195 [Actinomycetota bacterium]|nr:hypothetical protein [Actinomycetota bacterium]